MALKSFTFGGVNSLDYGVGITGAGVYSAPERDVEIIEVQGRNGNYILDNGRFHNIELTYPAVMGDTTQGTFAQKIADFRNAMLSKVGYQRLEDEYHPDEYRLGACVGGLDVDPDENSMAGEFDVKFNCKPQRFLKSGETEVSITSGGTITNPTAFPSSPLLMVEGYGDINLGDETVSIQDSPMGLIKLADDAEKQYAKNVVVPRAALRADYTTSLFYARDIGRADFQIRFALLFPTGGTVKSIQRARITRAYGTADIDMRFEPMSQGESGYVISPQIICKNARFGYVGEAGYVDYIATAEVTYTDKNDASGIFYLRLTATIEVTANSHITLDRIQFNFTDLPSDAEYQVGSSKYVLNNVLVKSTYSTLGNPLYLDLENGQAYKYDNDNYVSVNNAVWLGAELPTLKSGATTITYENTIHDLKIIPRWWKI